MIIAHVAPFAPNRCGLYESARDMARADILGGNDVLFYDAGITKDGIREAGKIGEIDNRGDFKLTTCAPGMLDSADIIIMHTGIEDFHLVRNQVPLIWVVHGRPLACFRPERMGKSESYSLYNTVAGWPRTKGMLYFWPEFSPHWEDVLHGKDIVLPYPPIDENRFNDNKTKHVLTSPGDVNILLCDSEREDIDLYELSVGLVEASKKFKNIKFHYYGMDLPDGKLSNCWNILLGRIKKYGCLGDVAGRMGDMEKIYNAMDCVISPNRIITRTIGEALSCGIPVITQNNPLNLMSDFTCDMSDPFDIVEAIGLFMESRGLSSKQSIRDRAKVFSLKVYSDYMKEVYKKIVGEIK